MDREIDPNKINVQTPRRTLGMGRMIRRTIATPPAKRPNQQDANSQTTPKVNTVSSPSSQTNTDNYSLATPKKHRKVSMDKLDVNILPKEMNDSISETQTIPYEQLKAEISQMKARLDKYRKYQTDKKELLRLIQLWCNGGKDALKALQQEILPEQEIEQIQTHLNIPIDIFEYEN